MNSTGIPSFGSKSGIDLRDWFAGQALTSVISTATGLEDLTAEERAGVFRVVSQFMYEVADAMIAARNGETK